MTLWALLPFLCFVLLFLFFLCTTQRWRFSFLFASLAWGVFVVFVSEMLSLFNGLTRNGVLAAWVLFALALAAVLAAIVRRGKRIPKFSFSQYAAQDFCLLAGVGTVVIITGLVAITAAPNNWDSMTYHMSRVVHWIQNRSVAHYPTHIQRQLYQGPWAEFAILQFQILGNGDRLANMVQWFSMAGSLLGISLLVSEMGFPLRGQLWAAFAAAVLPMGILQSSSTQNDYAVALWLIGLAIFVVRCHRGQGKWGDTVALGVSLGLGALTKATAYIIAVPFLVWFFAVGIRQREKRLWRESAVIFVLLIVINLGHYSRNTGLYGSPLSGGEQKYFNEVFSPGVLISNLVRNGVLHLGAPQQSFNQGIKAGVAAFHRMLGLDPSDPRSTWGEFDVPAWSTNEDIAGNPLHLALIVIAVGVCLGRRELRCNSGLWAYLGAVSGGVLLFCLVLKWQLFHSRLQLPFFLLAMPLTGMALSRIRGRWIFYGVFLIFLMSALPYLLHNERRPLLGKRNIFNTKRASQYFSYRRFMEVPFVGAVKFVGGQGCSDVGLLFGADDWEYPFWALFAESPRPVRLRHVHVKNISAKQEEREGADSPPCAVITQSEAGRVMVISGLGYQKSWQFSFVSVYTPVKDPKLQRLFEYLQKKGK